ncbi:hypothetical protein CHUAL_003392 [Chamberlinius hualienensis]
MKFKDRKQPFHDFKGRRLNLAAEQKELAIKQHKKTILKTNRKKKFQRGSHGESSANVEPLGKAHNFPRPSPNDKKNFGKVKVNLEDLEQQRQKDLQTEMMNKKLQQEKKEAALLKRKEERLEKFKQLNRKTKKGQPVMKHRMSLLLKQIQKKMAD